MFAPRFSELCTAAARRTPVVLAAGLLAGLQAACTGSPDPSPLPGYVSQLARTANATAPPVTRFVPPPYPDAGSRRAPRSDLRVGLGEFLDLKACGLRSLVAERNSALGKLEGDSLRLVYEHALATGLARCLTRLEASGDNPELAAALREVLEAKRLSAGAMLWNATLGSREFAALYRVSAAALDPLGAGPAPDNAIRGLAGIVTHFGEETFLLSRDTLVAHFEVLERSGHGGRLAKTLGRATQELAAATGLLGQVPCPTSAGDSLVAASTRFESGDVGQWLDALVAAGSRWQGALDQLLGAQTVAPPAGFIDYYDQLMNPANDQGIWPAFLAGLQRHKDAWAETSARCKTGDN